MVFSLAKETGWGLDYILWEIPISILNQGMHTFFHRKNIKLKRSRQAAEWQNKEISRLLGL